MKKCTDFLMKLKSFIDRDYVKYVGIFYLLMLVLYLYVMFGMGFEAPKFTYAEF